MKLTSAFLAAIATTFATAQDVTKLVTFDGAAGTTFEWSDLNDPVMGGASTSTFKIENNSGVFNGTCAIVQYLHAPGFAKITTDNGQHKAFADISSHLNGTMDLRVRSSTASYKGFKVAFGAKNVPKTSIYGNPSFKAPFMLKDTSDWQVVSVPFSDFSYDWSPFTGQCDTKDPTGQQHHCCSASDNHKYCPTAEFLSTITDTEVWAEGVHGDFHLEIDYIGASDSAPSDKVCSKEEYCCPDAKHCLKPTTVTCNPSAAKNVCEKGQACCPLTHLCVDVGAACTSPCKDQGSYCCPDALHCLTPTNPGKLCTGKGTQGSCSKGEVCCPVTQECVSVGAACSPP